MTTLQILQAIAPQIAASAAIDTHITLAQLQTSKCAFGAKYELAVALRAAHTALLAESRPGGETGNIASKSEGELSVSFGGSGFSSDAYLSSTHFGQQLLSLTKGSVLPMSVTGQSDLLLGVCGADS